MSRGLRKTLAVEQLEPKQMMAGDVTVSLVGGNLRVVGDEAGNQIAVTQGADANSFVIQGLNGTNVKMNGTTAPETGLVVNNVRGLVNVSMGGGDDSVSVSNATFKLALSIETGAGNDTVLVGSPAGPTEAVAGAASGANVNARGALNIFTGSDNDTVRVADVAVGGFLNIATLGGDDTVQLGVAATPGLAATAAEGAPASVRAGLAIDVALGEGTDSAQVNSASAWGAVNVGGGGGGDQIGLTAVRAASLLVSGGLDGSADVVNVSGARAFAAVIGTGGGADQATIADSTFTALEVAMGGGDDALTASNVTARQALLSGGEGSGDQWSDGGNNSLGRLSIVGFEIPEGANVGRPPRVGGGLLAQILSRLFR
jgi:hypothetical protein